MGTPLTLAWFFANQGGRRADCFDARPVLSDIAAQAQGVPHECLLSVKSQFADCVDRMLDVQLGAVLGAAWNTTAKVIEALILSERSPTRDFDVPLLDHEIRSIHRPTVKVYYSQALVARVEFEVELSLHLEAIRLLIQKGRITEVQSGTCSGAGELKWNSIVLVKGSTRKVTLPGNIRLARA